MKKELKKYIILIISLILTTGCQSYRELNDMGIATAVSINYNEEEQKFELIAQVVNTIKQQDASSSGEPAFITFSASASTIQEAFRNMVLESPRKLYGAQIQILVLSESIISNHLDETLDFFTRNPEIRSEVKIIVAQNNEALKSITMQTLLNNLSSSNILSSLESTIEKKGTVELVTLNDLTNMYLNPYLEIVLPSLTVEGNIEEGQEEENKKSTVYKSSVKIGTSGIFKDGKLLEYLDDNASKCLNLIRGSTNVSIVKFDYKDGYIVFEPNNIKVNTKVDVKKNKVTIEITGFTKVYEITSDIDIQTTKNSNDIEDFFNKKTEENLTSVFTTIREKYNADVFKFRDLYYKTDPKYFKEHYNNWYEEVFPKLELEVKSNIKLYEKGNTKEGIKYERKNK